MRRNMFVQVKRTIATNEQPAIQMKTWFKKLLILSRIHISAPDALMVHTSTLLRFEHGKMAADCGSYEKHAIHNPQPLNATVPLLPCIHSPKGLYVRYNTFGRQSFCLRTFNPFTRNWFKQLIPFCFFFLREYRNLYIIIFL